MFRYLFVLFILGISLYGLYGIFLWAEKNLALREDFQTYLSWAIERNTGKRYTVVFDPRDFIDSEQTSQNLNIWKKQISSKLSIYSWQQVIWVEDKDNNNVSRNFWIPEVQDYTKNSTTNCHGGLIYDPCLVIRDPIPATEWMRFRGDRG